MKPKILLEIVCNLCLALLMKKFRYCLNMLKCIFIYIVSSKYRIIIFKIYRNKQIYNVSCCKYYLIDHYLLFLFKNVIYK
jgi:hypothetical protein